MPVTIHPTAIVNEAARLGEDVRIGPFCMIGPDVVLGDRVTLHSHVVIEGHTSVGADSEVFPFAVLGCPPQHAFCRRGIDPRDRPSLRDPRTCDDARHRHRSMKTVVGNHGLFLVASHVAHDCVVGDHAIFANNIAWRSCADRKPCDDGRLCHRAAMVPCG